MEPVWREEGELSMKKAIIIGASSGIGMQLAHVMARDGLILGLTGRRVALLKSLQNQIASQTYIRFMDITNTDEAIAGLNQLIHEMDGVDLIIISAGIGHINQDLDWMLEKETIHTNVLGATAMIDASMKYFLAKGHGHLAVISSVAGLRGSADCPAYNASKAYISNYVEGIRCKVKKQQLDIAITDIRPGLVDTQMAKGEGLFWVMPLEKAATQMYSALKKRKEQVYVTKRWGTVAFVIKHMPRFLYEKL